MQPPAAPTPNPGPAGHEQPPAPGPGVPYTTSPGFTGTPDQSTTAATIAGLPPNSPQWVAAVQAANANGGVLPGQRSATGSPFDSDPSVANARAAEQLGIPSVNTNLQNLIAQRIANYGDASLASQAGFGLDPQAAAFTRQNYLTGNAELARLDHAHSLARQAIINRLAGHGLLFSGETGYDTGQEDQQYGNNVYDAQAKALADILGYRTNALSQTQGLHSNTVNAIENAYQLALQHPELFGNGQTVQSPQSQTTVKAPSVAKAVINRLATSRAARA